MSEELPHAVIQGGCNIWVRDSDADTYTLRWTRGELEGWYQVGAALTGSKLPLSRIPNHEEWAKTATDYYRLTFVIAGEE